MDGVFACSAFERIEWSWTLYRRTGCVHRVTTKDGTTVVAVVWGRTEPI
jgi:hypothetical protein